MRYIDADKLIAEYDRVHIGAPGGARKLMVDAPTADVAPKSEVASEIFMHVDYITRRYVNDMNYSMGEMLYDIDDLKKKYTEDQT